MDYHLAEWLATLQTRFPKIIRPVTVGTVNARTGKYELFHSEDMDFVNFTKVI